MPYSDYLYVTLLLWISIRLTFALFQFDVCTYYLIFEMLILRIFGIVSITLQCIVYLKVYIDILVCTCMWSWQIKHRN